MAGNLLKRSATGNKWQKWVQFSHLYHWPGTSLTLWSLVSFVLSACGSPGTFLLQALTQWFRKFEQASLRDKHTRVTCLNTPIWTSVTTRMICISCGTCFVSFVKWINKVFKNMLFLVYWIISRFFNEPTVLLSIRTLTLVSFQKK